MARRAGGYGFLAAGLLGVRGEDVDVSEKQVKLLESVVGLLTPMQRLAVTARFGLDPSQLPMTLEELAQLLGITRPRALQMDRRAMRRMRRILIAQAIGAENRPADMP